MDVFEIELGGRKLIVESGKMAKQANGAVLVRYGDTAVLSTATASAKPREGADFFPLTVDCEEKMYSSGKIPGGFQMLGEKIFDPHKTESSHVELDGLKLLPIETTFSEEKFTQQIMIDKADFEFLGEKICAENLIGYEIHSGFTSKLHEKILIRENIFGTYVHGIFDNDDFRRQILNAIRLKKNLPPLKSVRNLRAEKQKNYDRLAEIVRENLNMNLLQKIIDDFKIYGSNR